MLFLPSYSFSVFLFLFLLFALTVQVCLFLFTTWLVSCFDMYVFVWVGVCLCARYVWRWS
ncbi:hypothetical protein B0T13DRAFT_483867 [Neurospora crassa]|nr:hypothetical protein B0T13DRAFT_483867 [Neurospora crassa]